MRDLRKLTSPICRVRSHQKRTARLGGPLHGAAKGVRLLILASMCACGGESSSAGPTQPVVKPIPPVVQLSPTPRHTNQPTLSLSGSTTAGSTLTVAGGASAATASASGGGAFTVSVPLEMNQSNTLSITATSPAGLSSPTVSVIVSHDDVAPSLSLHHPSDSIFDTDGDSRVNIAFSFSDDRAGIQLISATNNRAVGGGTSVGGLDAGANLLGGIPIGDNALMDSIAYNVPLRHEFPIGDNTLIVTLSDSAGNIVSDTIQLEISGTEPSFSITQPSEGDTLSSEGFVLSSEFSDVAGIIKQTGLVFLADQPLIGLLSQDGTKRESAAAGENFAQEFYFSETLADLVNDGSYAFTSGRVTFTGYVTDMAGNSSPPDTVTVTVPTPPHSLLVVNSVAAPGVKGHLVSIGLNSFSAFGGVQFSLDFDSHLITVDSLSSADRVPSNPFYEVSDSGSVDIILVDLGGAPISSGSGLVVNIYTSINPDAADQDLHLTLTNINVADDSGNPVDIIVRDGILAIRN